MGLNQIIKNCFLKKYFKILFLCLVFIYVEYFKLWKIICIWFFVICFYDFKYCEYFFDIFLYGYLDIKLIFVFYKYIYNNFGYLKLGLYIYFVLLRFFNIIYSFK